MTGHLLRTDCPPEFRRNLSRGTLGKSIFMISGSLEKSLPRVPSKWFLETLAASKLILGGPWASYGPLPWDPLGSQGSPPMGSLGLLPRVPSHGILWAPKGSPPMGSLGLPRVPLPWDPNTNQYKPI